jgi:hypothetical protein
MTTNREARTRVQVEEDVRRDKRREGRLVGASVRHIAVVPEEQDRRLPQHRSHRTAASSSTQINMHAQLHAHTLSQQSKNGHGRKEELVCFLLPCPRAIHPPRSLMHTYETLAKHYQEEDKALGHGLLRGSAHRALQLEAHQLVDLSRKLERQLIEHLPAEPADDHADSLQTRGGSRDSSLIVIRNLNFNSSSLLPQLSPETLPLLSHVHAPSRLPLPFPS